MLIHTRGVLNTRNSDFAKAIIIGGGLKTSESLQEPTGNQAELHFHSIEMKRDQIENLLQSQEVFLTCQPSFCSKYNQDLSMLKAGVLHESAA